MHRFKFWLGYRLLWPGDVRVFVYAKYGNIHEVEYNEIVGRENNWCHHSPDEIRTWHYYLWEPPKPRKIGWANTYAMLRRSDVGEEHFDLHQSAYVLNALTTIPIEPSGWNPFGRSLWVRKKDKFISLSTFFDVLDNIIDIRDTPSFNDWLQLDAPIFRNFESDVRDGIMHRHKCSLHQTCLLHEKVGCATDIAVALESERKISMRRS
jgi:hypothetical protein